MRVFHRGKVRCSLKFNGEAQQKEERGTHTLSGEAKVEMVRLVRNPLASLRDVRFWKRAINFCPVISYLGKKRLERRKSRKILIKKHFEAQILFRNFQVEIA